MKALHVFITSLYHTFFSGKRFADDSLYPDGLYLDDMKILEVKNLNVAFNGTKVVENLNFEVDEDDNFAIIGPNGSGKTVLFRALLGTVPYAGEIKWAKDIKIGYVPQKFDMDKSLPLTLEEFLKTKMDIVGSKTSIKEILSLVGLHQPDLKRSLGKLSGGQFQRALIAFALIGNPSVLLFDEPTASIDEASEEQIYETIHRLQDVKKMAVLIISHDLDIVNRYATKVLCLNRRQVCLGIPEDIMKSKNLMELFGASKKYYHHIHGEHN